MSAYALDLFNNGRGAPAQPRQARVEVPFATPDDMKRTRVVQAILTCAAPRPDSITFGGVTPRGALERILAEIGRLPGDVSITAPTSPHDVEIRDESTKDGPRHLLALAFTGLNIAEARTALAAMRTPASAPSPKGRRR